MNAADLPQPADPAPPPAAVAPAIAALGPAVLTEQLAKHYGKTVALADLSMSVQRGETFGFLGPNGAGKTTAVKLLLGLTAPTSLGTRGVRRRVGYLPELFRYQPWLRAREVLDLHCDLIGMPRDLRHREVKAALETVGLVDRAESTVGTFSKGMQQRLGLGVALLGKPELVILDEPTSALDPVGRLDVRQIIHNLHAAGTTVFLNSHLLGEVELVCDRVAIVDHGRVISAGSLRELLEQRSVRVDVTGLGDADIASLGRFGRLRAEGSSIILTGIDETTVPELVAEIVRLGGQVHAVVPGHASLEERFIGLLRPEAPR